MLAAAACGGGDSSGEGGAQPADPERGRELFAANCAACHGAEGAGTGTGPPLVHEYYVPSHHADEAFHVAVQRGVQAHHWEFGPMPAIRGLSQEDVDDIVAYVRELQRDAGLID